MVEYRCDQCAKMIYGHKASCIKSRQRRVENSNGFCSPQCAYKYRSGPKTTYKCEQCGFIVVGKRASRILYAKKIRKFFKHGFCSTKCKREFIDKSYMYHCDFCTKELFGFEAQKKLANKRRGKLHGFCSKRCYYLFYKFGKIKNSKYKCDWCHAWIYGKRAYGILRNKATKEKNKKTAFGFCSRKCNNLHGDKNIDHRRKFDLKKYRENCEFRFSIFDYPKEFDLVKFKKFGQYNEQNKDGLVRDHIFSINDGLDRKISPILLRHPANCAIMDYNSNNRKHKRSDLTLKQLCNRILKWYKKYGDYPEVVEVSTNIIKEKKCR